MKQLVQLKPLGKFFFGGSRTFADNRQSYYAHSEYFPQQTAILGMLRYEVLKLNNALDKSAKEKVEIVGTDFDGSTKKEFGKIKSISPVFIFENESIWLPAGKDHQFYKDTNDKKKEVYRHLLYDANQNKPGISGFDHKEYLKMRLAPYADETANGVLSKGYDYFFQTVSTVGNKKNDENEWGRTRTGLDDAFYKDDKLIFKRDKSTYKSLFAFGIWIECEDDLSTLNRVFLGRETAFEVEVIPARTCLFDTIKAQNEEYTESTNSKIVLLNNAYITDLNALRDNSDFVLAGDAIPFRYIESPKDNHSYFKMPKGGRRSVQSYLLERGTVIYPKNLTEIKKLLNNPAFQAIGYNYYRILPR